MTQRPWSEAVDRLLGSAGASDAAVEQRGPARWSVGPYRVVGLADGGTSPADHERFLERLSGVAPFAVPRVIGRDGPWLVTEAPVGTLADRPDRHPEPGALAGLIGSGLAALHALPPSLLTSPDQEATDADVPAGGRHPWAPVIERCRRSVEAGLVESAALPPPYDRYRPERLLEMLIEASADGPARGGVDQPVLGHGNPEADRFVTDGDRFVGFDGLETALVADRHLDLAVAHLAVAELLGAEAVYALYEAYGRDPDIARLDLAVLAVRLLTPTIGVR